MRSRPGGRGYPARIAPGDRARRRRRSGDLRGRRAARRPEIDGAMRRLLGPDGPPLVAHRAKDLIHGLRMDIRSYARTPRSWRTCSTRRPGSTCSRSWRALPGDRGAVTRRRARHPRLRRCGRDRPHRSRAVVALRLAGALRDALVARELLDLYERIELRSCACWPAWKRPGSGSTGCSWRSYGRSSPAVRAPRASHPGPRRRGVQCELDAPAANHPLRTSRPGAGEEERRRARHRRDSLQKLAGEHPSSRISSGTARSRSSAAPTPTPSTPDRADGRVHATSSRRTTTGRTRARTRISRTCRCAPPTAGPCAGRSSPTRGTGS